MVAIGASSYRRKMQETLFHIVSRSDWAQAQQLGRYEPSGFAAEGFIHLSKKSQILRPANLLYHGRDDLLLLVIETSMLGSAVVFEPGSHGEDELFPHLYSRLGLDTVIGTVDFPCRQDGSFELPAQISGTD